MIGKNEYMLYDGYVMHETGHMISFQMKMCLMMRVQPFWEKSIHTPQVIFQVEKCRESIKKFK